MKQRLLQVGLIFLVSLLFVSSIFAEDWKVSNESKTDWSFSWIAFQSKGVVIAKVTEKCEIVVTKKVGTHIQAELKRYKGVCEDMKALKDEVQ